jgi:capsid portal protein
VKSKQTSKGRAAPARTSKRTFLINRSRPLHVALAKAGVSLADSLLKAAIDDRTARSGQAAPLGRRPHPFDMVQAAMFLTTNTHHAAAIKAKRNATTGLGFVTEYERLLRAHQKRMQLGIPPKPDADVSDDILRNERSDVAIALDPLCTLSFQDVMTAVGEDLANTDNGFIEVLRKGTNPKQITGLHHLPAHETWVFIENETHDYHFEVQSATASNMATRKFARFGDKDGFMSRISGGQGRGINPADVSEVIHLKLPSSISRYYGVPAWLSSVAAIELVQALHQHEFDFYNNRGVPEFLLFLLGKKLGDNEWNEVKELFEGSIGLGNTHKTGAFNLPDPNMKVQLEKLAMEGKSDGRFSEMNEALALEIVSGHRIPPLLAGIAIPGKIGAANEIANALMAYQVLTVAPDQQIIQATFANTLGNPELNGGLALDYDDFEPRTILDVFPIGNMDTIGRMKQSVPSAAAEGRNPADGLKKELVVPSLDEVLAVLLERAADRAAA